MNIGVAIVTHNNARDISACIESVLREGIEDIAVVDSASRDMTLAELSRLKCNFKVLEHNRGFGYAANEAARMLNTEYVLFLNPDAVLGAGSLKNLKKTIEDYPGVGIIGMLLCDANGVPEGVAYGKEPNLFWMMFRHFYYKKPSATPFLVDWVSGGALVIRADVFRGVGGFDQRFFLYWEDVDVCRRVRKKGYSILVDPTARVTHERGGSNLDHVQKTKIYDQSADRYFKKHYSTTIWKIQKFLRRLYRL